MNNFFEVAKFYKELRTVSMFIKNKEETGKITKVVIDDEKVNLETSNKLMSLITISIFNVTSKNPTPKPYFIMGEKGSFRKEIKEIKFN